jgi:hypothetical protein
MTMEETHRARMSNAIGTWLIKLDGLQGWKEYRRNRLRHTLDFDDPFFMPSEPPDDFVFPPDMEKQHAIVTQYLGLQQTIEALKECEFYFRRYPFRGLPVTRHAHITNVCEMYFGRFYEFKERLKKYFNTIKAVEPHHTLEIGKFVKLFEDVFDQELRARNNVHHHSRFEDIVIDKVFLTDIFSNAADKRGWKQEHLAAYRKAANEWSKRVRARGAKMDEFLEATAGATLTVCGFLTS